MKREIDNACIPANTYIRYLRFMYYADVLYFTQHNIQLACMNLLRCIKVNIFCLTTYVPYGGG